MKAQVQPAHGLLGYLIPVLVIGIVLAIRMRSMNKVRPLKLETLWVVPALYLLMGTVMFVELPPRGWVGAASAVALVLGAVLGWQRGKLMRIDVDPETHALNQKASPAAIMFLIALVVIRSGARSMLGSSGGVSPAMLTDPLIAFAFGLFTLTRVEMYLRAKRLLAEAKAGL